ncbi:CENP-B N-terminal DNA-binding domain [Popillia japonica]|uniref:CENP-B N-terminal DNA-binding domain n=1 Tax=Popillia japonica TaxID=7064 RepID=A0AAW1I8G7_POPJA
MASSSDSKRKQKFLTIESKVEILNRRAKSESARSLAKFYDVGKSTITAIKKNQKKDILRFASKLDSDDGSKKRKTMRTAKDATLDDAVFLWFTQRRSVGEPISGPLFCEKALDLNKKNGGLSRI